MEKILSQEEIDALLRGIEDGKVDTNAESPEKSGIIQFDFSNQDRIIRGRMPTLEIMNDLFSRLFRNTLSMALRKVIEVSPRGVQMVKFGEFIRGLSVPSSLHVFRMDPLRGNAVLSLDPKLVFTLVDIFLGGSGKNSFKIEGRDFTGIESKLIHKVVTWIFTELEKVWKTIHPLTIQFVRSEINPQFVSIVSPSDLVITVSFGLEIEQFTGMFTLCIPYSMMEPIKAKLYSGYQSDQLEVDHNWVQRFSERLHSTEVGVVVELGGCQITPQNLLKLKVGDVLPLEKNASDFLIAKVQGVPKFFGKAGVYGGHRAFQVAAKATIP
jgi:flagellar motor switch protein FliM